MQLYGQPVKDLSYHTIRGLWLGDPCRWFEVGRVFLLVIIIFPNIQVVAEVLILSLFTCKGLPGWPY